MAGRTRDITQRQRPDPAVVGRLYQTNAVGIEVPVALADGSETIPLGYVVTRGAGGLWVANPAPSGTIPSGTAVGDMLVWDGDSWEPSAVVGGSGVYDPERSPSGQAAPSHELNFKAWTGWPVGWVALGAGDFVAHDVNVTRPGALWARSTAGELQFRGRQHATLIPAATDFCIIWRPWITGQAGNYCLTTTSLGTTGGVTGNGVFCWTGYHSSYGNGHTYAVERFGTVTGSPGSWQITRGMTQSPGFMGIRRIGTTYWTGTSPDGAYWQWHNWSHSGMADGALWVAVSLYGSQGFPSEGGFSMWRLWVGDGSAKTSGRMV